MIKQDKRGFLFKFLIILIVSMLSVSSVMAQGAPTAATGAATGVSTFDAVLNGTVNANGSVTTVVFEYGESTAYGTTRSAEESPVNGTTDTAVSAAVIELLPNTTYHFRVVATNVNGTSYGEDMTFTTLPQAPTVTTNAAAPVGATTATLNGTVNANGDVAEVTFQYGPTTAYGTTVTAVQSPVSGAVNTAVSADITGLTEGQTYHYRVVAVNNGGTGTGTDMTFTTGITAPTATTNAATGVGATTATLRGTVNANGSSTTVSFEWGLTTSYNRSGSAVPGTVTGTADTPVSLALSSLLPGATYHYRVVAENGGGAAYGADMTFVTTKLPPAAVTLAATNITADGATLNGMVNAFNDSTTVTFQYGLTTAYGSTVTASQSPVTGIGITPVNYGLTGLSGDTTYHYRVAAQNSSGTTYGADMTFYTGTTAPTVITGAATAIERTRATLNGTVNANNNSTEATFEFGLTTGYGRTAAADQNPVSGSTAVPVSAGITGLTAGTTYHYRLVGVSGSGTGYGDDMTFVTGAPGLPTVETEAAGEITATTAVSGGNVTDDGGAVVTTRGVCWNTSPNPTTADNLSAGGIGTGTFSVDLTGLTAATTYYYRAYATNALGTAYGTEYSFTTKLTDAPTVTTAVVTNITASSAVSGGTVTDGGITPVTARGVCWSTAPNPTLADNFTTNGTGVGSFTGNLTGLAETTTYYVRAYATNTVGTAYGNEIQFTTNAINTPTVNTLAITDITTGTAASGGVVSDNGGSPVTARGVCWNTVTNPTIADNKTSNGTGNGTFTSTLTGLAPATHYYVRAYATNSHGTAYGAQLQFDTNSTEVTVEITEPSAGETVSGTITIAATASVNSAASGASQTAATAIAKVEFYIDNEKIAEDTAEPYQTQWDTTDVANGSHAVKAVAYDQSDNMSQDEISVMVSNGTGEILLNRTNLNYGAITQANGAADGADGVSGAAATGIATGPQTVLIDSNNGTLDWSVSADAGWISITPESGQGPGLITVSVNPAGKAPGTYTASLTVEDNNTAGSAVLPIYLRVYNQGATSAPFGIFATPADNAHVQSSIPVTGWVLDDIEVTSVQLFRDPVQGEGSGPVFIGDAVFVDGARPDVEDTYPENPFNYQAGWGYMLLTYGLPNQGNGTYTLIAKATDAEGKTVTLGTKTITVDNAHAEKPFGAIDTPAQGGVASGSKYVDFGWALTPQPNSIPTDGTTMLVWVDGVPLGKPSYNENRPDIAALFPGYANSSGAGGHFYLDTTKYANGVHTISWSVKDSAGNTDGIGSRYFSIVNVDGAADGARGGNGFDGGNGIREEAVRVLRGIDSLNVRELDYVAIKVDEQYRAVRGYLEVNGRLDPLPIGSTLDIENSVFYWQPGPGFQGTYTLVFVVDGPEGQTIFKRITITIRPYSE